MFRFGLGGQCASQCPPAPRTRSLPRCASRLTTRTAGHKASVRRGLSHKNAVRCAARGLPPFTWRSAPLSPISRYALHRFLVLVGDDGVANPMAVLEGGAVEHPVDDVPLELWVAFPQLQEQLCRDDEHRRVGCGRERRLASREGAIAEHRVARSIGRDPGQPRQPRGDALVDAVRHEHEEEADEPPREQRLDREGVALKDELAFEDDEVVVGDVLGPPDHFALLVRLEGCHRQQLLRHVLDGRAWRFHGLGLEAEHRQWKLRLNV
mmetsp:Transcript_13497/g.31012  ORF Transcript_13497/g.31012 Transcript_13497/m.31012 type:complete len:266 (-) Transcript_13497:1970-2767(-)